MNLSFDYYHNLNETELYLVNPDGRELFPVVGTNRILTLRFNDLSELAFTCFSTTTNSEGEKVDLDYYDYIQTRRRIIATGIGEFIITNVNETDNGVVKMKDVVCSSGQIVLQDKGVYCEDRVYYFYNPSDPTDANYDANDEAAVPSVVGQLYQQLGVQLALSQGLNDPVEPYDEWTITYINTDLRAKARSFKEETCTGYEWLVKSVEEAYECIILFDFRFKTIHAMLPSEITEKANVIYTFSNFMKDVKIEEASEDIVTVLNCEGTNCDITTVNPTGTKYICDFSYYMDDENRWMSSALKTKLTAWKNYVDSQRGSYSACVASLQTDYLALTQLQDKLTEISTIYTDLDAAEQKRTIAQVEGASPPYGTIWCETVEVGSNSMESNSTYRVTTFNENTQITAYQSQPQPYNTAGRTYWLPTGSYMNGTAQACYEAQYLYFVDVPALANVYDSYCKLEGKAVINAQTYETDYTVGSFKRYTDLYRATVWKGRYDTKKKQLEASIASAQEAVDTRYAALEAISSQCNIINYFSDTPALLRELGRYWIEGDYTNDNIEVTDETTAAQTLDLALELLQAGELELSKVCQPKLQFSITSVDCSKLYEFRNQMSELELGKVITVEKEEGVWYYPALLEMEYNLDTTDTFSLTFANALRLDDWGYTYGDLLTTTSSVSKQVGANWQNMLEYSKDKSVITPLIENPLSSALRATFANMNNQEFKIDDTGILGRKFANDNHDSFSYEQMRIVNNMIIFTNDNWATAKAALGKITYTNSGGNSVTAYGLVAEVLIGSLLLGSALEIRNSNSSVVINDGGIVIKQGSTNVFKADTSGDVVVKGNVTANAGYLGGTSGFTIDTGRIYSSTKSTLNSTQSGIYLGIDGFSLRSNDKASYVTFNLASNSFVFSGIIYASGGKFTGDGIDVVATNGQMSYIDNLGVENLAVRGELHGNTITVSQVNIEPLGSTKSQLALKLPHVNIYDECFTSTASTTITFSASVNCSATADYIRFVATVTTGSGGPAMPSGMFVTVNASVQYDFGEDYGGTTTISKTIDVYIEKGATSGSTTIDVNNRFHVAPSRRISQSVTSISPTTYTYAASNTAQPTYGLSVAGHIVPGVENTYDLGLSNQRWDHVHTNYVNATSVFQSSDRRLKTAISYDFAFADRIFNNLKPAVYVMKSDSEGRKHFGFIAQDIADILGDNGMVESDYGLISYDNTYSLNYSEFAAMNVWEIQQLKKRIVELEQQLTDIKERFYETKNNCDGA